MTGKMVHDAERDVDIDTLADRHLELSGDFTEVLDAAIDDQEDMGRGEILRVVMEAAAAVLFQARVLKVRVGRNSLTRGGIDNNRRISTPRSNTRRI